MVICHLLALENPLPTKPIRHKALHMAKASINDGLKWLKQSSTGKPSQAIPSCGESQKSRSDLPALTPKPPIGSIADQLLWKTFYPSHK
jgi:hypothetical protein